MKRQSLYIGGALLVTTALSTTAMAGSFVDDPGAGGNPGTVLTPIALSAQVFGSTSPENVTLGTTTIYVNFSNSLTMTFDFEIESTNSDFDGSATAVTPQTTKGATGASLNDAGTFSGCTVQVLTERVLVEDCLGASASLDGMRISGVVFDEANGLSTVGNSIALSGLVRGQSGNTFETLSSATLVTSQNGLSTTASAGSTLTINNSADPPFSSLTGGSTTGSLGTVRATATGAIATDLSTTILAAAAFATTMEFTITHGVLTDGAVTGLDVEEDAGATTTFSIIPSSFVGSVASVNITGAAVLGSYDIQVNFDGSAAINAWSAGTVDVAFSPGSTQLTASPAVSGSLASLVRGGFSTQFNTTQSTAGTGATLFQSLLRIVNNGSVAGTVTLTVRDDADGSLYGNFTTETIEPNSSIQVSMAAIEEGLSITQAGQYQTAVSGSISGYAQHVMFNSVDNLFVDLSGFRNDNP